MFIALLHCMHLGSQRHIIKLTIAVKHGSNSMSQFKIFMTQNIDFGLNAIKEIKDSDRTAEDLNPLLNS